jgi:Fic family protein
MDLSLCCGAGRLYEKALDVFSEICYFLPITITSDNQGKFMDVLHEIDERMEKVNKIRPFEGPTLQQINQFFKVITTYSSNAIEGNLHTLNETKTILEDGIKIKRRSQNHFYEIEGHGQAYDYMFSLIKKRGLTEKDILQCHLLFSIDNNKFIDPGKYRKIDVIIKESKRVLPKFEDIPDKMLEYISWLNKERKKYHPVLFAAEANRRLGNIHPFNDGNGRIARLVMNTCLFQDKYFPVSIPVLKWEEYFNLIEANNSNDFGIYIAQLELQTIKDFMRLLHIK